MAPEQRFAEEKSHLVVEAEHLLAAEDDDSSAPCFSWRGFFGGRIAAVGLVLLLGALASSLGSFFLAHQAFNCSSSEGWAAKLICHRRSAVHGADPSHALLLDSDDTESDEEDAESDKEDDAESDEGDAESDERDAESDKGNDIESDKGDAKSDKEDDAESGDRDAESDKENDTESGEGDAKSDKKDDAESGDGDAESDEEDDAESGDGDAESDKEDDAESGDGDAESDEGKKDVAPRAEKIFNPASLYRGTPPASALSAQSGDSAFCNPASSITESGWKSRAWDLQDGFKLACKARNRLKDHWKIRFSAADRNWCWVGVKDMCHRSVHRPQNWDAYREAAFQQSLAPSSLDSPFDPLENPALCDRSGRDLPIPTTPEEEEQAKKWFSENVKVYVVSLPRDQNRSDLVSARLQALGIQATRLDGVDMNESGMLDEAKGEGWIPKAFSFTAAQKVANEPRFKEGSVLGTISHASLHFKAQNQIVKDGALLGLVLEDDSYLIDGFVANLWRIVTTELPCDWDIVQLLARCPYGRCISKHLARIQPDGNEPDWRCRAGVNLGMHAMLYRTGSLPAVQELWQATTFNEKSPQCLDVDVALASISDRVGYYAIPSSHTPGLVKEILFESPQHDISSKTHQ